MNAGNLSGIAADTRQKAMRAEDLVDLPRELNAARREDDEGVTHALELRDDVRREHHGEPLLGHGLHQRLQELAARKRIERGHRLVEHEQLGPFGQGERERDLRLLAPGKPADLLTERDAEPGQPRPREVVVPPGVQLPAQLEHLRELEPAIERMVLCDESDTREHEPVVERAATNRGHAPRRRSAG